MNTIKSIVVISTLLAVGYGAHFVLKQQPLADRFAMADGVWQDLQPDLDGMQELQPQVDLPELAQTSPDAMHTVYPSKSAAEPGMLPVAAAQGATALAAPSNGIEPKTLRDLRRSPALVRVQAETADVVAPATAVTEPVSPAVVPAIASTPAPPVSQLQPAYPQLPVTPQPVALEPVPPLTNAQPPANSAIAAAPGTSGYSATSGNALPSGSEHFGTIWAAAESDIQAGNYASALAALSALYSDRQTQCEDQNDGIHE